MTGSLPLTIVHDALDRLVAADYGSAHTELTYDLAGRKNQMIDADMGTWYYSYDASSNLTGQTDARGCLTSISYDLLNRPTGKSYSGSCGAGGTSVTYGYDAYTNSTGYRTSMSDGSGSTIWRHDPRGRLRMEEKTITGSGTFITEWSYNSADLVEWMKYPGGNGGQQGETVTFTYVPQMLVKTAIGATTYVKNATYDAAGRTDILDLGLNGSQSYMYLDYNYYAWNVQGGRLQWLQGYQTAGAALRQKLEYAYDAAGNVDWIKDYLAGSPYQLQDFSYDLINRLDAASATGGDGQGLYNENYDYDSQGNLWKKGAVGSETVYTYLDGAHKHAVTHLGGAQKYWYDLNGNMTTRKVGTTTYTQGWDAENRLVSVSGTGVSASFVYDGDGTRVKGTVNGTVTAYVGNWFEWTGSTSTMKKYYYGGSQRIAMRSGSGTGTSGLQWIIGDHLGSTSKIANYDGTLNSQRRYRPWGEARFGGALPTTYRYTGQRQEDLLGGTDGLYYYGARWYDAALGRWLSPDSIIPEAAQGVQAWSRYTYVNNAPTRYQDPTGHCINFGLGAAIGAATGFALYAMNVASSKQDFNWRQAATVAAVGAISGAMISTGVGAVAGFELFAGVGMAAAGGGYLVANTASGDEFKTSNFLVTSAYGFANGALGPLLGTTLPGAVALGGSTSAAAYAVTSTINGDAITTEGLLASTGAGMVSGLIGGAFPRLDSSVFVANPKSYLASQAAGSFIKGLVGTTLTNYGVANYSSTLTTQPKVEAQ